MLLVILGAVAGGKKNHTTQSNAASSAATTTAKLPPVALNIATGDYAVTSAGTTLHGTVTPGASVIVNGTPARVTGSRWTKVVALRVGANVENVEAMLEGHEPTTQAITVTRRQTPAEIEAQARAKQEAEQKARATREQQEQKERAEREQTERKEHEEQEIENATPSQKNALNSAEQYLSSSAFSEAGLIEQLSSEAGSKYPQADAEWAVKHMHVDWNQQAVKAAKEYLSSSSFSCEGLVEQLDSEAGSKFTQAQAEYAGRRVGLC